MLRIHALGGLSVRRDTGPTSGAGTRRRPLALLAILAAGNGRGVSRDKIIAYLWPEADEAHARGVFRQTLYSLRRDLGQPDLLIGATELRLNPEVVTSDVAEFGTAFDRGEPELAIALYSGPFLDGFHVGDAPEFEEWADGERQHLRRQALLALGDAAHRADRHGDHEVAAAWWRRVAELDPLSSRVALGLMRALVASGDKALALQHAQAHDAFVRYEVRAAPDPAVAAFADHLRATSVNETRAASTQPDPVASLAEGEPSGTTDAPHKLGNLALASGLVLAAIRDRAD